MGPFDDAWAEAVAEPQWPERLVEAVRRDPGALATVRAVRTLRAWRRELDGPDTDAAWAARRALERVGAALLEPDRAERPREVLRPIEADRVEAPAAEGFGAEPPTHTFEPSPALPQKSLRGPSEVAAIIAELDDADISGARRLPRPTSERSVLDSPGTQVIRDAAILESRDVAEDRGAARPEPSRAPRSRGSRRPEPPREGSGRSPAGSGSPPPFPLGAAELDDGYDPEPPTTAFALPGARGPGSSPAEALAQPVAARTGGGGPPPHRRRAPEEEPRPPAARTQVVALAAVLRPLAEELVPLSHPRRSRRFWARWREVAGDRGVRRHTVEDLLGRATTVDELLAGLISEALCADPSSVLSALPSPEEKTPDSPAPPDRRPEPLVGSSALVRGLMDEES